MDKLSAFKDLLFKPVTLFTKAKGGNTANKKDELALTKALLGIYNERKDGHKIRVDWNFKQACQEGFEASTWVYACVTTWMSQVASVPWIVREKSSVDGEWTPVPDCDLAQFMDRPNPFMSWSDLTERLTGDLLIGGNCVWKKVYAGSPGSSRYKLMELWPYDQDRIKPVPKREDFIAEYLVSKEGQEQPVAAKEVVHFMLPDPSDIFWGISPLKAVAKVLDADSSMLEWWINAVQSGCRKDGILSFKHDLTKEQYDLAVDRVRQQILIANGSRFPIIMGHEAQYTPYDMSPAELDWMQSRKMTREEIAAAFHVPPPLIGILDHSTYNNLTTARRIFWVDAVIPFLERIKSTLNRCLLPDFYKGADLKKYRIDFDISKVEALADDFSKKLEQAQILIGMGIPLNVINRRLELDIPDVEGGDVGYILENYVPLDMVANKYLAKMNNNPGSQPPQNDTTASVVPPKALKPGPLSPSIPKLSPKPDGLNKKEQERFDLLFAHVRQVVEDMEVTNSQ